jgi:hypothetical protein
MEILGFLIGLAIFAGMIFLILAICAMVLGWAVKMAVGDPRPLGLRIKAILINIGVSICIGVIVAVAAGAMGLSAQGIQLLQVPLQILSFFIWLLVIKTVLELENFWEAFKVTIILYILVFVLAFIMAFIGGILIAVLLASSGAGP